MKNQYYTINLNKSESWLIALFFKRITFDGVLDCTDLNSDKDQAYQMIDVIEKIQNQLADQGMAPR